MHIGEKLCNFSLKSVAGNFVSNFDFADKYSLLIIVTSNHCRYALSYWQRLIKLTVHYEEDSLGVVAICGNNAASYPQDSFESMQEIAKKLNLPFSYLHNPEQDFIRFLGATRTPEVFLFNNQRELVYRGAIDDNWENENLVSQAYLEDAIEYCLDGLEVDYPEIEPVGCSIKWIPGNEPAIS